MKIKTLGVVGAGTMGNGIAQVAAVAGCKVLMLDVSEAALEKGLATLTGSLDIQAVESPVVVPWVDQRYRTLPRAAHRACGCGPLVKYVD